MATLLDIPVEIRQEIWTNILHPLCINRPRTPRARRKASSANQDTSSANQAVLNLVSICRAFYSEVLFVVADTAHIHLTGRVPSENAEVPLNTTQSPLPSALLFQIPPLFHGAKHVHCRRIKCSSRHLELDLLRGRLEPGIPISLVRRRVLPWTRVTVSLVLLRSRDRYETPEQSYSVGNLEVELRRLDGRIREVREYAQGRTDGVDVMVVLYVRQLFHGKLFKACLKDGEVGFIGDVSTQYFGTKEEILGVIAKVFGLDTNYMYY